MNRDLIKQNAINDHYAIISFNIDGTIKETNEKFLKIFGYSFEEIENKFHRIFCDEQYANSEEYKLFWHDLIEGKIQTGAFKRVKKSGEAIFVRASYTPLRDENGNIFEILKFAEDITQKRLENLNYEQQLKAIDKSQAIIEFDMNGFILKANTLFLDSMGYEEKDIIGKHHNIFCDKDCANSSEYKEFWENLKKGKFDTGKYLRISKNGKKVWIQATYTPILDLDKKPYKVVKFAQDITLYETIKKDHLTNLYNREKLVLDINSNQQNNLAIIDIDDFASINDFYGYTIGDEFIVAFSKLLKTLLNENFELYRIYADKFAILNSNLSAMDFCKYIISLNNRLKDTSLDLSLKKFELLTSCGISFEDNDKLLNSAEISNKYAKKILKNVLIYSKELNIEKEFEENIFWFHKIKSALKEDRVIVHYQPIFNNKTNQIEKYESLVRILDEDGTIISPYKFLDVAKKSKQYLEITKVVISKSFEKFKDSQYEFSINLTVEDILDRELNEFLISKIEDYKIGNKLVIELVESEKITTYEPVYEFIEHIKKYGCKIAIDDFGSGYSNFEYLIKIDADYVKIDGSIISKINENENSLEIVKSIITFCKKMEIKTIGEFVSDKTIFDNIVELGVDYSQGFFIGRPE